MTSYQSILQKRIKCVPACKRSIFRQNNIAEDGKGQRLPSLDYIREICQYIKISSKQEEELVRLYKIEKLGHSTVKAWDEIQQIILDIYQLRKMRKVPGIFVLMK